MIHTATKTTYIQRDNTSLLAKKFFSCPGDGLLPLVELPPDVVRMVLDEGLSPLGKLFYISHPNKFHERISFIIMLEYIKGKFCKSFLIFIYWHLFHPHCRSRGRIQTQTSSSAFNRLRWRLAMRATSWDHNNRHDNEPHWYLLEPCLLGGKFPLRSGAVRSHQQFQRPWLGCLHHSKTGWQHHWVILGW